MVSGGFGESIAHLLPGTDIVNLGWPDKFIEHGDTRELKQRYGLDPQSLSETVVKWLEEQD